MSQWGSADPSIVQTALHSQRAVLLTVTSTAGAEPRAEPTRQSLVQDGKKLGPSASPPTGGKMAM